MTEPLGRVAGGAAAFEGVDAEAWLSEKRDDALKLWPR